MAPRRLVLWGLASTLLAIGTVIHAFRMRSNCYAAAVYLAKSNACTMILWNQGIFQTVMLGKALQAVFLGDLRLIEIERLQERGWFAITETLLALTIFKDDFESTFVLLFVGLLFLKVFHWLASDRVEMMEQAARVSRLAHARMLGLLSLLWIADIACLIFAVESIMIDGPTVMIMFASEYLILIATVWTLSAKYLINCIDMRSEAPWEEKSIYVFYVELAADFFKLCTYLTFFGLILTFYGLPLNILRDVYLTLRSFILKVRDLRRYRQATRNMDELYPIASREEMDAMADKTCIICREDMEWRPPVGEAVRNDSEAAAATGGGSANEATDTGDAPPPPATSGPRTGPNDTPKKLPCGHVFHFHCLRSWLERQQSCPTCRRSVLPNEQPTQTPRAAAPQFGVPAGDVAAAQPANGLAGGGGVNPAGQDQGQGRDVPFVDSESAAIRQAQVNLARNLGREAFTSLFPGIPFPPEAENPRGSGSGRANSSARAPTPTAERSPSSLPPPPPPAAGAGGDFASGLGVRAPLAAATGTGDNPLARFSLPELPVPSAGEASLFQEPPAFVYASPDASTSSTYSNLAYGAYPRNRGGGGPNYPASPFAAVQQPPNIIERLETVRRRWTAQETPPNTSAAESSDAPRQDSADAAPPPDAVSSTSAFTAAEKGKSKEMEDSTAAVTTEEDISPREAALRAAERRLGHLPQTQDRATQPTSSGGSLPVDSADSLTTDAEEAAHPPDHAKMGRSETPLPIPRLIPLFDPAHPTPLVGEVHSWTPIEVEGAVTKTLEEKLRTLAEFQERLDSLIGDLRTAMAT